MVPLREEKVWMPLEAKVPVETATPADSSSGLLSSRMAVLAGCWPGQLVSGKYVRLRPFLWFWLPGQEV